MARSKAWESNVGEQDEYDSLGDGVDYFPEYEEVDASDEEGVRPSNLTQNKNRGATKREKDDSADEADGEEVQQQISRTSFGALKQAQEALSKKRKRGSDTNEAQEEKLAALRSRLNDLRSKSYTSRDRTAGGRDGRDGAGRDQTRSSSEEEDSDSAPSEVGPQTNSRSSKHAPAMQSSRHQVTRKRNVIDVPKRTFRDPRFDALRYQPDNLKDNSEKAYAFLNDYQKSEIKELKAAIKATKDEGEKETLRRKMVSMENRLKSKAAKERENDVVRKHRREEREKVEQGKQPYYLKQKDIKQKALEEKFKNMKGKDREKLMERRRKKEGQQEKKRMPMARRVER